MVNDPLTDRWVLRDTKDFRIEVEVADLFLIFHLPRLTRPRMKELRIALAELEDTANRDDKMVACAFPADNFGLIRLVIALGMKRAEDQSTPDGTVCVFHL